MALEWSGGWCGVSLGQGSIRVLWPQELDMRTLPQVYGLKNLSQDKDFPNSKCWDLCDLGFQQHLAITKDKVTIEKLGDVNPRKDLACMVIVRNCSIGKENRHIHENHRLNSTCTFGNRA